MAPLDRLSPSKLKAFRDCPQQFAFRYVERLDEPEDAVLLRGSLVHLVCERLFDVAPEARTRANAVALLHQLWECLVDDDPPLRSLFIDAEHAASWILSAERLVVAWFALEDPASLPVDGRELYVETSTDDGILAGVIDRLDRLADGTYRVTDYKTGPAPSAGWERGAFFQLRFYAVVLARQLGVPVTRLRLVHLGGGGEILELDFDSQAQHATTRQIRGLTATMQRALAAGAWATNVGRRCDWCGFRPRCPAWSGSSQTRAVS